MPYSAPDRSSEETAFDKNSDVELGDTDCVLSVSGWRLNCARKAPANCVTLEIDKILIRYFSSQTVTAQKLLYLGVGMDFALLIFPLFSSSLRRSCIKSNASLYYIA